MTTQYSIHPIEAILTALKAAEEEHEAARLALADKLKDAFPGEQERVRQADAAIVTFKGQLQEAIGAYGPLPADAKSPVGWAHYSSALTKVYAPVDAWNKALVEAGLAHLIVLIITESINAAAVNTLVKTNADFHKATDGLITKQASKPVLRYGFAKAEPDGLTAELLKAKG